MEPTLNIAFTELKKEVAIFLGFGGDSAKWSDRQEDGITSCLKGGLRRFYYDFNWSFLKPVAQMALATATTTIEMPDDFGGIEGRVYTTSSSNNSFPPLDIISVGQIVNAEAQFPSTTGCPQMVCLEQMRGLKKDRSSRQQLHFWPTSDGDYTIKFQYYIEPNYLTGAYPYAYGGPAHAGSLLAACKAYAEANIDDIADGPKEVEYQRALKRSIEVDSRNRAQTLGYNGDNSDRPPYDPRGRDFVSVVSVNGVTYP